MCYCIVLLDAVFLWPQFQVCSCHVCYSLLNFWWVGLLSIAMHTTFQKNSNFTSGCPWPSDTVKSPGSPSMSWKSCAKIEIPHPENHILKVFRFRSWKPWVWKSRPQSWDPKSWKPCLENHILKFPRSFWVLETRSANSRSPKIEDPTSWKSCPKNFQVWVLETHTVYIPKLKSHVLKIMSLKIPCLGFGEAPSASKL